MSTTVTSITRHSGIAGQIAYDARLDHGEHGTSSATFHGSTYGGPIVLILPGDMQAIVTEPERFGPRLSPQWVRNFYAAQAA